MSDAIKIANVSKAFRMDVKRTPLIGMLKGAFKKKVSNNLRYSLRDINLTIRKGEKIGLIGHNGAGKTTMLKLIAGLYKPTSGEIHINGRISFLAGFGIGMLDELSVAENIFLYGAIYGISRTTTASNLDEIVAWAGLSEFVDTKFKHLSSGMKTRLAFSTTRYFDADIYLLDEAMSAGDQSFKQKCEKVFEDYKDSSRTLVVASHTMDFLLRFCNKTIWLDHGKLAAFGPTEEIVRQYAGPPGNGEDGAKQDAPAAVAEQPS